MIRLNKQEQILARWLRIIALFDGVALLAVVMPRSWMASTHAWLGLGTLPSEPIVGYLARSTSLLYGFLGVLAWVLSSDVRRYAPLVTLFGRSATLGAGVFLYIDVVEGLPDWWRYSEWLCVLFIGQSVLALQRRTVERLVSESLQQVIEQPEKMHG